MIDKIIYKATINGIAAKLNNHNNISDELISTILIVLSLFNIFSCLVIFKENSFILLTIKKDSITEIKHRAIELL